MEAKRIVLFFFVFALCAGMVFAGGGKEQAPSSAAGGPFVISMLVPFYQQEPPNTVNNPVLDYIQQSTNVRLDLTWVPNGEMGTKFNVMMAGNDMTMLMHTGEAGEAAAFLRMASTGAFWDITNIVNDFPYLTDTLMAPAQKASALIDGKRYALPMNTADGRIGMLYRQDWVENLGIQLPETLTVKDFYDLCAAFTERDPDGNGRKDTTGFCFTDDQNKEVSYGFDTVAVGLGTPNQWGYRNGKIVPYFDTPEYMNTLNLLRDMYQKGYLNEDFAILGSGAKYNPMLEQRAGIMFTTATNGIYPGGKYDTIIATNPNVKIGIKYLFLDPSNKKVVNSNITAVSGGGGIVFTTSKIKTEADVRRIMQFFVDAQSGECAKAIDIGVKDVHYSVGADGKISISPAQAELRANDGSREIFMSTIPRRVMEEDWGQPLTPLQRISLQFVENTPFAVQNSALGLFSAEENTIKTELDPLIIDARVQFIMGRIGEAEFRAAVQQWKNSGGQALTDSLTAKYNRR